MPIIKPFTGPGSTPSRRRFWDKVTQAVESSRKLAGRNVTIDEHPGKGTVVNVFDTSARRLTPPPPGATGACCYNDGTCDDLTESDCTEAGGNWQGPDTTCDDDPNPCVGACCEGEDGTTCVDDSTPDSCAADGGTFQDFGSTCDDIDCTQGACCADDGTCSITTEAECTGIFQGNGTTCDPNPCVPCVGECCSGSCSNGFDAFDGSGRKFLRYQRTISGSLESSESNNCDPPSDVSTSAGVSGTLEQHYEPDCTLVTDVDTSSSEHSHLVNGVDTDPCSIGDVACFCSSIFPSNICDGTTFYGDSTNCGNSDRNTVVDPDTATNRTTTITFSQDTSQECFVCEDCTLTCHVGGTYVVTETLSNECIPT